LGFPYGNSHPGRKRRGKRRDWRKKLENKGLIFRISLTSDTLRRTKMLRRLVLVAGILVAVVVAVGPMGVSLFSDGSVMASSKCDKCKHDKCTGDCTKCPDCAKK
jgi:hypothetical protein